MFQNYWTWNLNVYQRIEVLIMQIMQKCCRLGVKERGNLVEVEENETQYL